MNNVSDDIVFNTVYSPIILRGVNTPLECIVTLSVIGVLVLIDSSIPMLNINSAAKLLGVLS
jgi:hypothetical protein